MHLASTNYFYISSTIQDNKIPLLKMRLSKTNTGNINFLIIVSQTLALCYHFTFTSSNGVLAPGEIHHLEFDDYVDYHEGIGAYETHPHEYDFKLYDYLEEDLTGTYHKIQPSKFTAPDYDIDEKFMLKYDNEEDTLDEPNAYSTMKSTTLFKVSITSSQTKSDQGMITSTAQTNQEVYNTEPSTLLKLEGTTQLISSSQVNSFDHTTNQEFSTVSVLVEDESLKNKTFINEEMNTEKIIDLGPLKSLKFKSNKSEE